MFAKGGGLLSGLGGIAGTVAKFVDPVGLTVRIGGKPLFDSASAGIEEMLKNLVIWVNVKRGSAGAERLVFTLGLVSQETISGGLQTIGDESGSVADGIAGLFKSDAEKQQDKLKEKQEQLDKEMYQIIKRWVYLKSPMDEKRTCP